MYLVFTGSIGAAVHVSGRQPHLGHNTTEEVFDVTDSAIELTVGGVAVAFEEQGSSDSERSQKHNIHVVYIQMYSRTLFIKTSQVFR